MGKCPQCNAKAHRKDIRPLFARILKVNVVDHYTDMTCFVIYSVKID